MIDGSTLMIIINNNIYDKTMNCTDVKTKKKGAKDDEIFNK